MQQNITSHIKKGLLIAATIIIYNIIAQLAHYSLNSWFTYSSITIFIIAIFTAVLFFKKQVPDATFGVLLTHGFKTTAVATCIIFLYSLLAYYIIFPNYIDDVLQAKLVAPAKAKGKSLKEIETDIQFARKVLIYSLLSVTVMLHLISGALGALAGAGIGKKIQKQSAQ